MIDDEQPARDVLEKHISGVEALELAGSCTNAVEALSFLQSNTVDLLFLDIQMPHILGTNFIRTLKNPPKVIFTTAYRKYAIEGFELNAVDYLLKPISFDRFLQAVNKIFELNLQSPAKNNSPENQSEPAQPFLYLRVERKMIKVLFNEILYIEGLRDYIRIFTTTKTTVQQKIEDFHGKFNVVFAACEASMQRQGITKSQLLPQVVTVPLATLEISSKQQDGWSYIKAGFVP